MARLTSKKTVWYPIPGDEDNAEIQILHLKPGDLQDIESETSRWLGKSVDKEFVTELELNPTLQMRRIRQISVVGWKGMFDENGDKMDCTQENVLKYLKADPFLGEPRKRFSEWIDEFRKSLAAEMEPQEAQAEGN